MFLFYLLFKDNSLSYGCFPVYCLHLFLLHVCSFIIKSASALLTLIFICFILEISSLKIDYSNSLMMVFATVFPNNEVERCSSSITYKLIIFKCAGFGNFLSYVAVCSCVFQHQFRGHILSCQLWG